MIAFAYGSNMDRDAMAVRCPQSKALCAGRLIDYRLVVMQSGYASVVPERGFVVHGVLLDLAPSDVAALDRYEEVARGLYRKQTIPVLKREGGSLRAMVYIGQGNPGGTPQKTYWDPIIAAAKEWDFPEKYLAYLYMLGGSDAPQATIGLRAIKNLGTLK